MVRAGESGGVLGLVLERLAEIRRTPTTPEKRCYLRTLLSYYLADA